MSRLRREARMLRRGGHQAFVAAGRDRPLLRGLKRGREGGSVAPAAAPTLPGCRAGPGAFVGLPKVLVPPRPERVATSRSYTRAVEHTWGRRRTSTSTAMRFLPIECGPGRPAPEVPPPPAWGGSGAKGGMAASQTPPRAGPASRAALPPASPALLPRRPQAVFHHASPRRRIDCPARDHSRGSEGRRPWPTGGHRACTQPPPVKPRTRGRPRGPRDQRLPEERHSGDHGAGAWIPTAVGLFTRGGMSPGWQRPATSGKVPPPAEGSSADRSCEGAAPEHLAGSCEGSDGDRLAAGGCFPAEDMT